LTFPEERGKRKDNIFGECHVLSVFASFGTVDIPRNKGEKTNKKEEEWTEATNRFKAPSFVPALSGPLDLPPQQHLQVS
jgi:hypothetical protein